MRKSKTERGKKEEQRTERGEGESRRKTTAKRTSQRIQKFSGRDDGRRRHRAGEEGGEKARALNGKEGGRGGGQGEIEKSKCTPEGGRGKRAQRYSHKRRAGQTRSFDEAYEIEVFSSYNVCRE